MKGFTMVLAVMIGCQACFGAEILRGYLVGKGGSRCLDTTADSAVVDSSTASDVIGYASICTLMSLLDGTSPGQYIIKEPVGTDIQVTLNAGAATTFTNTGTQLTFTTEGTMTPLTGITSTDLKGITTSTTSVYVADVGDQTDNTDGTYVQGTTVADCANQQWYFVTPDCAGTNCATCNPDPTRCSSCAVGEGNPTGTACEACTGTNCESCDSYLSMCSSCAANHAKNTAETECVDCSGTTDCLTCNLDGSDNIVCLTCGSSKNPSSDGSSCDTTTTTAGTTTENSANLHQSSLLIVMGSVLMFLSTIF